MSARHTSLTLLLALLVASPAAFAAPSGLPAAGVTVSIDRMMYPDGIYRGSFTTTGACAPASDAVQVLEATCGDPVLPDASSGTVRMAKLGFDAFRRVDAGLADLPVLETTVAATPEQLDRVRLTVKEAGDLRVEVTGRPEGGLDPRPIAGSASSGGQITNRTVLWTVPNAQPGSLDFSVRFAPGAPAGSTTATYVPEVKITRTGSADRLLDHVGAPPPPMWPVAVQRTSTLLMRQHLAPGYGPPTVTSTPFLPTDDAFPTSFEVQAALDGAGAYDATASGRVSALAVGHLDAIAPGALGVINTISISTSHPGIPGADKFHVFPGLTRANDQWTGFTLDARTPLGTEVYGVVPPGPLAGIFWDGDVAQAGGVAAIGDVSADREGQPANEQGRLMMDWDGSTARAWSGLWANDVPFGEPNKLQHAKYERDVVNLVPIRTSAGYGPFSVLGMTEAALPVVVKGGDLDTTDGGTIYGEPVQVSVPQGHEFTLGLILTAQMPETAYNFDVATGPGGVTITPIMGPGGKWLESTQDGYARDWSNLHQVYMVSREMLRDFDGELTAQWTNGNDAPGMTTQATLLVPPGAEGAIDLLDAEGVREHRRLTPGLWHVTATPDGLTAQVSTTLSPAT